MRVGLIDVDGHNFPNIPLMKISSYYKKLGNSVEWYEPMFSGHMDVVYMSKVFSFTDDYPYYINADRIYKGGTGYAISVNGGVETFDSKKDVPLPNTIEHMMPDYELYGIKDTAYGFLTRGCPRGCAFCHVKAKEGLTARKVADLSEFWAGQKNIVLCDPNILACKDWEELFAQLEDSKAWVDFNQGLDIRCMTEEKAKAVGKVKTKELHFAWDRYQDKETILPRLKRVREISTIGQHNLVVYVLCGFDTTFEQDLERIYTLRDMGCSPYVMLYNKEGIEPHSKLRQLQRWVNSRWIFWSCPRFEDYKR